MQRRCAGAGSTSAPRRGQTGRAKLSLSVRSSRNERPCPVRALRLLRRPLPTPVHCPPSRDEALVKSGRRRGRAPVTRDQRRVGSPAWVSPRRSAGLPLVGAGAMSPTREVHRCRPGTSRDLRSASRRQRSDPASAEALDLDARSQGTGGLPTRTTTGSGPCRATGRARSPCRQRSSGAPMRF